MSYLLANGCSFTDKKFNTSSTGWIHTEEEKKQLGIPLEDWKMWPEYVADKLELLHNNMGKCGKSNESMVYSTIGQAEIKKPKVIMHLWTSGFRNAIFGYYMNDTNFIHACEIANMLFNRDSDEIINSSNHFPIQYWKLGFELLKIYYPEDYDKAIDFYKELSKDQKNVYDLQNVLDRRSDIDSYALPLFSKYYYDLYRYNNDIIIKLANLQIRNELKPFLELYDYCKLKEIPVITVGSHALGGHVANVAYENKVFKNKEQSHYVKMLKGFKKLCDASNRLWIDNYYFKRLDDLVADKKYVLHSWPFSPVIQKKHKMKQWLKGWKPVSHLDSHPNWDTQKLIGDLFYDLYKKNYS